MPEAKYRRRLEIARHLIESGCIQLRPHQPFTYASGLSGPIYCDNRLLLSDPSRREWVVRAFEDLLGELTTSVQTQALVGVATAGIPHAAFLAWSKKLPLLYVRSSAKTHGRGHLVEGVREHLKQVILVEDLVNQGGSLAQAVRTCLSEGLHVQACMAIVDYQMESSKKLFSELNVALHSLTDFDHLVEYGMKSGLIDDFGRDLLQRWRSEPKDWQSLG